MSMNGHAKRTIQTLEALDFKLDEDATGRGVRVYWHPNDPSVRLKVFAGLSEIAAKKIRNRADQIIGLSSAGERIPESIAENARIKRLDAKAKKAAEIARADREREPYQRAADAERRRREAAVREAERYARELEIATLMRPGRGH